MPLTLTLAHSPDPDDAFMWAPLTRPGATPPSGRFCYTPVLQDIQALNARAMDDGDLDITAISMHAYAHVSDRYALTACGASMGRGYGPKLVTLPIHKHAAHENTEKPSNPQPSSPQPSSPQPSSAAMQWLREPGRTIATPGTHTTANLVTRMLLAQPFSAIQVPFDQVGKTVLDRRADAGVVIHEGQLTYERQGLTLLADLGAWWADRTGGLPLPLGANALRRDLDKRFGKGATHAVCNDLRWSLAQAVEHRKEGVAAAKAYGRGVTLQETERFIEMYVNDLTMDAGEEGRGAIQRLLDDAAAMGLCPKPGQVRFAEA